MRSLEVIIVVFLVLQAAVANHLIQQQALVDKYQFSRQMHERYTLYWTYDPTAEEASFAVFVQTTGWVGFGLSPTGQMPGSDVVIGWVDDRGNTYFHDRYASERATPTIDGQQNWFLTNSWEDDGYTILEFKRDYVSCDSDQNDLDIDFNTARVVWSFKEEDPPNGPSGSFILHDFKGSASLNILGGSLDLPDVPDTTDNFEVIAEDVAIPTAPTTYWCSSFRLPESILDQEKYVIKVGPNVAEESSAHVHHLLVYLCTNISNPSAAGTDCDSAPDDVSSCLSSKLFGAWAIGGEDFVYPENVALPVGGPDSPYQYAVMQLHYDNPNGLSGVVDNSGMRFYYSSIAREQNAGIMELGHSVTLNMLIPPGVSNYTVLGLCPTGCTENFPDGGIRIFANFLHTHLLGVGVELLHLREQENCNGVRELKTIDRNLRYDFDYQNAVYLDDIVVEKGDMLLLRCIYDSTERTGVTLGGEGTTEEMCLSFIQYYPAVGINDCLTQVDPGRFIVSFLDGYVTPVAQAPFASLIDGYDAEELAEVFNTLDWTTNQIQGFQETASNSRLYSVCIYTEAYATELGLDSYYNVGIVNQTSITCAYDERVVEKDCSAGSLRIMSYVATVVVLAVTATMATIAF